ncbi:MAG TPA: PIN domain-containing protein [Candidatus Angelobacter sp.]|jgi:predicted nucleic acid-binding protein|nr:PIN domain-containing protein [Candidatus Angelobacter sp.]
MNDKFFLDTNIFAYLFDARAAQKAETARRLIKQAVSTRKGVVSQQVVQEFFSLAFRKFQPAMTVAEAEDFLSTVFQPLLVVQSVQTYKEALQLRSRYRLPWYDSVIVAAARESGCKILYTEDFQHEQRFGELRVKNPFL